MIEESSSVLILLSHVFVSRVVLNDNCFLIAILFSLEFYGLSFKLVVLKFLVVKKGLDDAAISFRAAESYSLEYEYSLKI